MSFYRPLKYSFDDGGLLYGLTSERLFFMKKYIDFSGYVLSPHSLTSTLSRPSKRDFISRIGVRRIKT